MARERAERNGASTGTGTSTSAGSAGIGNEQLHGATDGMPDMEREVPALSIAEIRQLITLMDGSDLEEIIIEHHDELKLVLRKPTGVVAGDTAFESEIEALDGASPEAEPGAGEKATDTTIEIGSPLVGVYRARVKPEGKLLVRPGDMVHEGQIVAAVEALNYVNEIESGAAGRVKAIFVRDGQPVEYGQPLLSIEPK